MTVNRLSYAPASARPILKWAGGKRQLLPVLRTFYPPEFRNYYEPFAGSAAVFFDLLRQGRLTNRRAFLSDVNHDLIRCYQALIRDASGVIRRLKTLERRHFADASGAFYYKVRDQLFNGTRQERWRTESQQLAAIFIYLNRAGYNGLYRVNARGDYNVPAGRLLGRRLCDPALLREAADAMRATRVTLKCAGFASALRTASKGDFVYLDPPYDPLTTTASFTAYTRLGFGRTDHTALAETMIELAGRGCHVVLSNSSTRQMRELFGSSGVLDAGFRCYEVQARRAINCDGMARGSVKEMIVTNVDRATASSGREPAARSSRGVTRPC